MSFFFKFLFFFIFCFFLSPLFALEAGTCKVNITPKVGTPLAGFGARMGSPSQGILDPLYARVLYLHDGKKDWAIVALDTLVFFAPWGEDIKKELSFEPAFLTFSASHTHAGSGALLKEGADALGSGPFNPLVYQTFVRKVASCLKIAQRHRKPAFLGTGSAQVENLSVNRRFQGGEVDGELRVLKVVEKKNPKKVIALLYNLSAHPTTVGGQLFSADFPGYASYLIERLYPESVALFVNGTQGDQGPGNICGLSGEERTRCQGFAIGWEVIKISEGIKVSETTISGKEEWLLLNPRLNYFVKMQALSLGETAFLAFPGEAYVKIGNIWKEEGRKLGFSEVFLMGLSNDAIGYIVYPEEIYHLHVYESLLSFFGPKLGEFYLNAGLSLLQELARKN